MRIVNCARGGLIDEAALKDGLESGHVAGAALDVFAERAGARQSPCSARRAFICTPHLGASTTEAQVNVAIQVAEQMSDFLLLGGITNAVNVPSLSAEEAPRLKPYMALAEKLGRLIGQIGGGDIRVDRCRGRRRRRRAQYQADHRRGAGRRDGAAGRIRVNMVNAPYLAKERGLDVREIRHDPAKAITIRWSRSAPAPTAAPCGSRAPCSAIAPRGWSRFSGFRSRPSSPGR